MGNVEPPVRLVRRIQDRIVPRTQPRSSCRAFWIKTWGTPLAAAALFLLILSATAYLYGPLERTVQEGPQATAFQESRALPRTVSKHVSASGTQPRKGAPEPAPGAGKESQKPRRSPPPKTLAPERIPGAPPRLRVRLARVSSTTPLASRETRLREASARHAQKTPLETGLPGVVVRMHDPALAPEVRRIILRVLGGQPLPAGLPTPEAKEKSRRPVLRDPEKERVEAETFILPPSAYTGMIQHLRELDPQLPAPPRLPGVEFRKRPLVLRLEYPTSPAP